MALVPKLAPIRSSIVQSSEPNVKDGGDNENVEERDCKSKTCDIALRPLFCYMLVVGLNHVASHPRRRLFFRLYNIATILIQIATSIRRLMLLQYVGTTMNGENDSVSPIISSSSSLIITHTLFHVSGCAASMLLFSMQFHICTIRNALDRARDEKRDISKCKQYMRRVAIGTVMVTFATAVMNAVTIAGGIVGYIDIPWTPALIYNEMPYAIIDAYVAFIAQSSIMMVGALFYNFCVVLRCKTEHLAEDMAGDDNQESCPTKEAAYQIVYTVQRRYQALQDANRLLELHFSYVLFFVYGCAIPIMCFLLYAWLRGRTSPVIGCWIGNVIGLLIFFSYPAFRVQEEGEKIIDACFKMYHQHLCQQRDIGLLLTSAILTYLIILMQFYTDAERRGNSLTKA